MTKPIKAEARKSSENVSIVAIGDKSKIQLAREFRKNILISFSAVGKSIPSFSEASSITDIILENKQFGSASIYYNGFKSVISYELRTAVVYSEESISNSGKILVCLRST